MDVSDLILIPIILIYYILYRIGKSSCKSVKETYDRKP